MSKFSKKSFEFKAEGFDDEKGVINGYGAVKHNKDWANDVIVDGAFGERKTLPFLFQHDSDKQIGVLDCWEDSYGLKIEAKYYLNTSLGKEAYELAKANAENNLNTSFSIGYRVIKRSFGEQDGEQVRFLEKIDTREISQVTFPCNELATATGIKSDTEELKAKDIEWSLREVMPVSLAKKYSNVIISDLREADEEKDNTTTEEEEKTDQSAPSTEVETSTEPEVVETEDSEDEEKTNQEGLVEALKNELTILNLKTMMEDF